MPLEVNKGLLRINLDCFSASKSESIFQISDSSSSFTCDVRIPFSLSEFDDNFLKPRNDDLDVFFLRNVSFSRSKSCSLRYKNGDNAKPFALIFALSSLNDDDGFSELSIHEQKFVVRGIIRVLNPISTDTFPIRNPNGEIEKAFTFFEFYDDDLLLCVVSKLNHPHYDDNWKLSMLYALHSNGFYLISSWNKDFYPTNLFQPSIQYKINISLLDNSLSEYLPFLKGYISILINSTNTSYSKFMLAFQWIEILSDIVLRNEIVMFLNGDYASLGGYKLKSKIGELSTSASLTNKLFSPSYGFQSETFEISFKLFEILDEFVVGKVQNNLYGKNSLSTLPDLLREYRNQIVHAYHQVGFGSNLAQGEVEHKLSILAQQFEYLISGLLVSFYNRKNNDQASTL